jgi:hypothetical protein
MAGSDDGMPGEVNFSYRRIDVDSELPRVISAQKDGFGKIEFACNHLHLWRRQDCFFDIKDRQLISFEPAKEGDVLENFLRGLFTGFWASRPFVCKDIKGP